MIKTFINPKSIIKAKNVKFGYGTRINGEIIIHGKGSVNIGKYCAFGYGIKIICTNHDTSFANQQLYLQRFIKGKEIEFSKKNSKNSFSVSIGNNVWIGNNVVITSGVNIGDGAVIGAGSVVTKNLEPFSTVLIVSIEVYLGRNFLYSTVIGSEVPGKRTSCEKSLLVCSVTIIGKSYVYC